MTKKEFTSWMWFEAVDRLSRAQRLHQQFFTPHEYGAEPAWQPPVDVLETETEVLIFCALPGVDPESVDAVIEGGTLMVSGKRVLPDELRTALIHQLELPQGRFAEEPLPPGRLRTVKRQAVNGCLLRACPKFSAERTARWIMQIPASRRRAEGGQATKSGAPAEQSNVC